jgi:transcriptional regulator GlxA family with amidase domain
VTSVGILRYDDVEVLDCCGPFEVFATATAGLDVSLHLVRRQAGRQLARATARQMDHQWQAEPWQAEP